MRNACVIQDGDHVILKNDKVMKVYQVKKERQIYFEKQKLVLDDAIGRPYGSLFEVKNKRLVRVDHSPADKDAETDATDAKDNRFLKNDGKSQKLTKEDIEALKDKGLSGREIIETLVENSTTFDNKNEYSKVKYLKKKRQKYLNQVVVLRPSARLLAEMYYAQGPQKILNLRVDSLAQILTLCNVHSGGQYMISESCMGLIVGATLERLGGAGKLVYMYNGDSPTLTALGSFNFSENELRCLLKIKTSESVLDCQETSTATEESATTTSEATLPDSPAPAIPETKRKFSEESAERVQKRKQRDEETKEAMNTLMAKNMDGLIIASKFHPGNILQLLMPYLALSRPFVIFCPHQQPLVDCYSKLKDCGNALMLHLSETWYRDFQVLENRTHPMISMSGASGYILTGITAEVNDKKKS